MIGRWENTFARVHTKYKSLMVCEVLIRFLINQYLFYIGEVAEWSNALVLKTSVPKGTRGSNPFFSANRKVAQLVAYLLWEQGAAGSSPVFPTLEKKSEINLEV